MSYESLIAPYLASSLFNLFKPENKSQFKMIEDQISIRMNNFLMKTSIPVTQYSNMLTFRDTNKSFKLDGDLLETMTIYKVNVNHYNPQERQIIYEFGKEMKSHINRKGWKNLRDIPHKSLLQLPAIRASEILMISLPENLDELCDRKNITTRKASCKQF